MRKPGSSSSSSSSEAGWSIGSTIAIDAATVAQLIERVAGIGDQRSVVVAQLEHDAVQRSLAAQQLRHTFIGQCGDADVERQEAVVRQVVAYLQRLTQGSGFDLGAASDPPCRSQQLGRGEGWGDEVAIRAIAQQGFVADDDVAGDVDDGLVRRRQVPIEGARDHGSVTFELAVNQLRGIAHP